MILTYSQQQAIKKISANNAQKYNQIAGEIEEHDLKQLLGVALLQDIQTNPTSTYNAKLLAGDSFVNVHSQTITHKGLKYVIAYLNYAKYVGESFVNDTFTGFVTKTRPDSELLSEGNLKRLITQNREIALTEFDLIRQYLDCNCVNFPLWVKSATSKPYIPKFTSIIKTHYGSKGTI